MLTLSISTSSRSWSFWRRSYGDSASSSDCFSAVATARWADSVSAKRSGSSILSDAARPSKARWCESLAYCSKSAEHLAHVVLEALGVDRAHREDLDRDGEVRPAALEGHDPAAAHALDHHLDVAVRELQGLGDGGDDADLVDVLGRRLVELRVALRGQEEPLDRRRERRFEGADRGLAAHDEGLHHVGEHDHVPKRDERQAFQAAAGAIGFHLGSANLSGAERLRVAPLIPPCAGW